MNQPPQDKNRGNAPMLQYAWDPIYQSVAVPVVYKSPTTN
jgi:hypothetical protein